MKRPALVDLDAFPFQWVTTQELAEYEGCDRRTILRMIATHALSAYRVGRCWRIRIEEARRVFPHSADRRTA